VPSQQRNPAVPLGASLPVKASQALTSPEAGTPPVQAAVQEATLQVQEVKESVPSVGEELKEAEPLPTLLKKPMRKAPAVEAVQEAPPQIQEAKESVPSGGEQALEAEPEPESEPQSALRRPVWKVLQPAPVAEAAKQGGLSKPPQRGAISMSEARGSRADLGVRWAQCLNPADLAFAFDST